MSQIVTTTAAQLVKVDANGKKIPNSQLLRNEIVSIKAQGGNMQDAIKWCMEVLGQTKALAAKYVAENWDRETNPARGTCKLTVGKSTAGVAPKELRKSDVVREMISAAKLQGLQQADLVEPVMQRCNFDKGLATTYIKNNWDKA